LVVVDLVQRPVSGDRRTKGGKGERPITLKSPDKTLVQSLVFLGRKKKKKKGEEKKDAISRVLSCRSVRRGGKKRFVPREKRRGKKKRKEKKKGEGEKKG